VRILYLGAKHGTALQRAAALVRLGHEVTHVKPDVYIPEGRLSRRFHRETGGLFSQGAVAKGVLSELRSYGGPQTFDAAWIDGGQCIGPALIQTLKGFCRKVINYNHDDPFGGRDRYYWSLYLRSIPHYDVVGVVRPVNVDEARAKGAKDVVLVKMAGDEVAHRPRSLSPADIAKWSSEVLFIGTWMPERGPFLSALVSRGVPLTIYGSNWQKAPEWTTLESAWKGSEIANSDDYARALQCSKIALGLLSKGNRDMHTTRSTEIPAVGALLCAERTLEHEEMYEDGVEAVFWSDVAECADVCNKLLANDDLRAAISARGHARVMKNATFNEPTMTLILDRAFSAT